MFNVHLTVLLQKSDDNNEDIVQPNDLSHNHNSAKYKSNLTVEI